MPFSEIICWVYIQIAIGYTLDLLIKDPQTRFHPICLIGYLISFIEKQLNKGSHKRLKGCIGALLVVFITTFVTFVIYIGSYFISPILWVFVGSVLIFFELSQKTLYSATKDVIFALNEELLEGNFGEESKKKLSMIVGRDVENLSVEGVIKADIETLAENSSDGIIAPYLCIIFGGPVLGMLYKAVNTLDSMWGYKNERYYDFGWFAAHQDDIWNFIPARISALLLWVSGFILHKDYKNGWRIFKRDRYKHASPNSAQTESMVAGLLNIQLGGPISYFGKVHDKQFIGDKIKPCIPAQVGTVEVLVRLSMLILFIFTILYYKLILPYLCLHFFM